MDDPGLPRAPVTVVVELDAETFDASGFVGSSAYLLRRVREEYARLEIRPMPLDTVTWVIGSEDQHHEED
jgi:hypothetical protein